MGQEGWTHNGWSKIKSLTGDATHSALSLISLVPSLRCEWRPAPHHSFHSFRGAQRGSARAGGRGRHATPFTAARPLMPHSPRATPATPLRYTPLSGGYARGHAVAAGRERRVTLRSRPPVGHSPLPPPGAGLRAPGTGATSPTLSLRYATAAGAGPHSLSSRFARFPTLVGAGRPMGARPSGAGKRHEER